MAIVLSSAEHSFREPKRKNRWILKFDSIPGADGSGSNSASEALSIDIVSASRPSISFDPYTVSRLNEKFHFAGSPTWDPISCSFYDYDKGKMSAGQVIYQWATMIYNPLTGGQGYAIHYKVNGTLVLLGPAGAIIEIWDIFGAFPENVSWQDLSYEGSDGAMVEFSLRFDYAISQIDSSDGSIPKPLQVTAS